MSYGQPSQLRPVADLRKRTAGLSLKLATARGGEVQFYERRRARNQRTSRNPKRASENRFSERDGVNGEWAGLVGIPPY